MAHIDSNRQVHDGSHRATIEVESCIYLFQRIGIHFGPVLNCNPNRAPSSIIQLSDTFAHELIGIATADICVHSGKPNLADVLRAYMTNPFIIRNTSIAVPLCQQHRVKGLPLLVERKRVASSGDPFGEGRTS